MAVNLIHGTLNGQKYGNAFNPSFSISSENTALRSFHGPQSPYILVPYFGEYVKDRSSSPIVFSPNSEKIVLKTGK